MPNNPLNFVTYYMPTANNMQSSAYITYIVNIIQKQHSIQSYIQCGTVNKI